MKEFPKIFNGYKEVVEEFWGLESGEYQAKPCGDWWTKHEVIMLDEIPDGNPLRQIGFENEVIKTVSIGDKSFEVLILTGDGGFNSMLFKTEDYDSVVEQDNSLGFV